jgi:hypothetical protein
MAIRTKPTDKRITHHVSLIKDNIELGLLLSDGRGNLDPKAFRQGNNPRTSLQIRQGDADYSDFELPYTPFTQKEWSGGRGNEEFEADKSRYTDSLNINAVHGRAFLGPKLNTSGFYDSGGMGTYITGNGHFFDYKGAKYFVSQPDDGTSAPILSMNGWRGVAKAGSDLTTMVTNLNLTGISLAGLTIEITAGTGYTQERRWRKIANNTQGIGGGDSIVVTEEWLTAAGTDTEFVIHGSNDWREITGHGLTKPVTSVVVYGEHVYFAMGEDTFIRRIKWTNTGPGTWTLTAANEAGAASKATFLKLLPRTNGGMRIWKVNNPAAGVPTAAYATPVTTWVDIDFVTKPTELVDVTPDWPIPLTSVTSHSNSKVNGLEAYGDPITPWILKEDEIGNVTNGIYSPIPLTEMRSVKHDSNGRASLQYGVYLFFSLLDGLERYYSNRLDDIGPNRELGFLPGRKGKIVCMVPYPGQIYLSVDGGWNGYSCILSWNGIGFHELFRAEHPNMRIREMSIQTTPDDEEPDRLYFIYGGYMRFIHVATNPLNQNGYRFTEYGHLQSARINGGFAEVNKFWHEVRIFLNRYSPSKLYARAAYRTSGGVSPRDKFRAAQDSGFLGTKINITQFALISKGIGWDDWHMAFSSEDAYALLTMDRGRTWFSETLISTTEDVIKAAITLPNKTVLLAAAGGGTVPPSKTKIFNITISGGTTVNAILQSDHFFTTEPSVVQQLLSDGVDTVFATTTTKVYRTVNLNAAYTAIYTAPGASEVRHIYYEGGRLHVIVFDPTVPNAYKLRHSSMLSDGTDVTYHNALYGTGQVFSLKLSTGNYVFLTGSADGLTASVANGANQSNVYQVNSIHLAEDDPYLTDAIVTGNDGILIATNTTASFSPITGRPRGFYYYSHDYGEHWIPYTPADKLDYTGGLYRLADDSILFGAQMIEGGTGRTAVIYRSDSDKDWTPITGTCDQAVTELAISTDDSVSGQRLQYMIELFSAQEFETPVLKAVTVDAVTRLKGKKSWVLNFLIDDMAVDLQGTRATWTAHEFITQLETWADSDLTPTPIRMYAPHTIFHNKPVFIEYPVITPIEVVNTEQPHKIKLICQLTVTEA